MHELGFQDYSVCQHTYKLRFVGKACPLCLGYNLILYVTQICVLFFIETLLFYNAVLVSSVQQSDSVIYTYADKPSSW